MLHAPTSEAKTETAQSKSRPAPIPERELHPHAFGAAQAYSLNGARNAAPVRSPEVQRHQIFAGMQATHGNQAVLRMMQGSPQVARMPALRPSQGVMLQRKCACGGSSESEGECAECKAKREAGVIQTKLAINQPGDEYELEADRIADQVLATPANLLTNGAPLYIQRLRGQAPGHVDTAPPGVDHVLASAGRPLDLALQQDMEQRFDLDFSQVRVHSGAAAEQSAREVNARAYTVGQNIVFGTGQFAPGTYQGRHLIAHELVHVVQQSGVEGRANTAEHNVNGLSPIHAHVSAVGAVQRQSDDEAAIAKDDASKALNKWEVESNLAINRYRNWLTHNMIMFLSDVLQSGKGSAAIDAIKGGFAQNVAEQALGNLGASAGIEIGARLGGRWLARLFLSLRTARVFGGFVGFVVGAIVEALIGNLLDKTNEIIRSTGEQMDKLVTGVVNPIVNSKQAEMTGDIQNLRDDLVKASMSVQEWHRITDEIKTGTAQVDQVFLNEQDESLYRQLALFSEVYTGKSVSAEEKPPVKLSGDEHDIQFTMQHRVVKTGETRIFVVQDRGTVVVGFRGYDCFKYDDGFSSVDITGPDASPAWRNPPPPREYYIQLYQSGLLFESDIGVPRTFHVGKEEYGIWYNLPKGAYQVMVWRNDDHIVALCAKGKYWVGTGQ